MGKYDNIRDFTVVLSHANHEFYGTLQNLKDDEISWGDNLNSPNEFSFIVYKTLDGHEEPLWNKIISNKLVYVIEFNEFYNIDVSYVECTNPYKKIVCTSACEYELGQIKLYDIEINTEDDISRDDYVITKFYDYSNPKASLLNRILEKAPHYTIVHVDSSLANMQRSFSINDKSIYDFLTGDCAKEFNCIFLFDSVERTVSVYDLYTVCVNCGYRGDYSLTCPECGSNTLKYFGEDTTVLIDVENLTNEITLETDKDNIKNSLKLQAGDDVITSAAIGLNPNGSSYVQYIDDTTKEDMSAELVKKLDDYDNLYSYYSTEHQTTFSKKICHACNFVGTYSAKCPQCGSNSTESVVDYYNRLVDKYQEYYQNVVGSSLNRIDNPTIGYEKLVESLYDSIDFELFLQSSLMPTREKSEVNASTEVKKLTQSNLSPCALSSLNQSTSLATINSALKNYAKVYAKSGYVKIEIDESAFSFSGKDSENNNYGTWTGRFKVTNYSDEEDIAYSDTLSIKIYDNYEEFTQQKIEKLLKDDDEDSILDMINYSITNSNYTSINDVIDVNKLNSFKSGLQIYSLDRLSSFYNAIQSAMDIMVEAGYGSDQSEFYVPLYYPLYIKLQTVQSESNIREHEVISCHAMYEDINSYMTTIKKELNFETYLGLQLYKEFCLYRKEDTYSNDNYTSDGLNNVEILEKAKEFLDVAKKEVIKSGTPQHSISTTLDNLFSIAEFAPIRNKMQLGNFIRVRIGNNLYRLRLVSINGQSSDTNSISVTFSDVINVNGIMSDIQSILSSAKSIATSYNYVAQQAGKGEEANNTFSDFIKNGLTSALTTISNNNHEEVALTEQGLWCREYDDVTDSYSPKQFRATHNILAYTDDNWVTSRAALGEHEYIYYNGSSFVNGIGYGLTSDFIQSGYVIGSQIISGDIYSSNYSVNTGTHLDLNNGSFSFAGGKFNYNADNNKMTMRGVTIEWDSSTTPEITDIDGLDEQLTGIENYLEQLDGRIQSYSQTTDPSSDWTTAELKNNHIGDLWFNPTNGLTKRWTGTSWDVITDSILESLAKSKAQVFTAKPTVAYFKGDMLIPVESFTVTGVTYKQEKAYRALKDSNGNTFNNSDWDALDYTNDDAIISFINGVYADDVKEIRTQIDGKARAWYQPTDPSLIWDTSEDHEGDLWYNTSASSQVTYIYKDGKWKETNVPKAVFDTIDGKRQIFVKKPTSPYMTGDLWIIGESDCTNGKITVNGATYNVNSTLIAILPNDITERTTFTASDWTDISTQDGIVALDQSTQALSKFDDIVDDGKITPTEKQQIKILFENIIADKVQTDSKCSQYGINSSSSPYFSDYTNFNNAFTTLKNLINNSILNNMATTIAVPSNYNSVVSDYYTKQNIIITDIERASKSYADSAVNNLDNKVTQILAGEYKTTIGEDYIISPHIGGGDININNRFKVDSQGNVTLPDNATITWSQVTGTDNIAEKSSIPTKVSQLTNDSEYQNETQVTQITKDTITTSYVNALNVKAGSVDAENITGTTISGKKISGGSITGTEINNGNGTFTVDSNGNITSKSGTIGAWSIDSNMIYSQFDGNQGAGVIGNKVHANIAFYAGGDTNHIGSSPFRVYHDGSFYATSGAIGGWNINSTDLYTSNAGMSSSDGKFAVWAGESNGKYGTSESNAVFKVGHNGALYASNVHISGEITATSGTIGGCSISNNLLQIDAGRIISGTINASRISSESNYLSVLYCQNAVLSSANVVDSSCIFQITKGTYMGRKAKLIFGSSGSVKWEEA